MKPWKQPSVIPGFGISTGFTLAYLSLIVLIPLAALVFKAAGLNWQEFSEAAASSRVAASYRLSFGTSLVAALINGVFGFVVAWVLVRYKFPGKGFVDMLVDLPFALPTAVAGIALTTIYSPNGFLGKPIDALGLKVVFTPIGITIALVFIGLPFVVRTVQPVLQALDPDVEEAAVCLGATRWQTFTKVVFPALFPALLTGMTSAFARALGEYGSVVFIAGNMPMKTEITPLLIMTKLEQYDYAGAAAIAVVMLIVSFVLLLFIGLLQRMEKV